jgi:hypothetical protein
VSKTTPPSPMDDEFLLPNDRLEVGDEIARGSFGAGFKAKLFGMAVCAKVCRGAALLALVAGGRVRASPAPHARAPLRLVIVCG